MYRRPESGAALPLVLVVSLAMTLLVSDFALRAHVAFDRSQGALRLAEARSLMEALEKKLPGLTAEQMIALSEDGRPQEADIGDFRVEIRAESLESKINVGRLDDLLIGPAVQKLFEALLKQERLEFRALPSALDWVDADDNPRPGGAERSDYGGEDAMPRNAPFETLDELTFVRGFRDPSAFERIRPVLTVHGSGKIYAPAASDAMMDVIEAAYGAGVRTSLDEVRRNPDRSMVLPSAGLSETDRQSIQTLLTNAPAEWRLAIVLSTDRFHLRSEYILSMGESGSSNKLVRIQ